MRGYLRGFLLCGSDSVMQDIPDASFFVRPKKRGTLLKLTGKGWLYSGSWKKRHCVLDGTKFYYYENEKSHGSERTCGVLSLDYYDVCEEYETKDKKNSYVFIIGTSVRGFFDNRHQFAAETEAEMQDWIRSVHDVIAEARNIRSRAGRTRIGSDKISPVITGNRIQVISQMNEETNDQETKDVDVTPLVNATKDRVRGPQGRRLPQRKSMMPPATIALEDDDVFKPRSFSLSGGGGGTAEDEESEDSPGENRRISLSLEIVDQTDKSNETNGGDNQQQRSSSSHDLPTQRPELHNNHLPKLAKKPIFGRLGGQHAALTKELELKLKSGLAPGGHRFHEPHPEETAANESDKNLDRKIESLRSQVSSMQKTIEALQNKIESMEKTATANNNNGSSTHWTDVEKNEIKEALNKANAMLTVDRDEIREILSQATAILKAAEETNRKSEEALAHAMQTNTETTKLFRDIQSSHGGITTTTTIIPDLMFDPTPFHS